MGTDALIYRFIYFDGYYRDKEFSSKKEAHWFAHNEGDHLVDFYQIGDK